MSTCLCKDPHLHNLHHDSELWVGEVDPVTEVSIPGNHGSKNSDDIISFELTVITAFVVHCKLNR